MVAAVKKMEKPPVVTIMGHVDHGKTTLLDTIRHSRLTSGEAGGITQHIGAYQIVHQNNKITFIDTPGHAAFAKMRARGAQVTDLVVLVVAANDGVKPQTKESLSHIKEAKAPFLIAITKIDLPEADSQKVKAQLAENNVLVEEYGGQVVCVEVAAKTGQGIDQLLEMILLISQLNELKADPKGPFEAVVIESSLDRRKGPTATIIVQQGTLTKGDLIKVKKVGGKVKRILNDVGQEIESIGPGDPGQILGFRSVPLVGGIVASVRPSKDIKEAKQYKQPYQWITKQKIAESLKNGDQPEEKAKIKLLIKSDTVGTLEAIKNNLPDEIDLVHEEVGAINESDILLAQAAQAQIIVFNLPVSQEIKQLAEAEGIKIRSYQVIYKLLEDLEKKVLEWIEPAIWEEQIGEGEIIAEFSIKKQHVAGCRVTKGEWRPDLFFKILRQGEIIGEHLRTKSFQKDKQAVTKVKTKDEVGIVFKPDVDFSVGDVIISYRKNK